MNKVKFSFVVLTWNRHQYPEKCIPALWKSIHDKASSEIIIMDNASTDGTVQSLQKFKQMEGVRVVLNRKNYGLNAYKKLFSLAKGKYIIEVDDDVVDFPDRLDTIFEDYMQTFPDYGYLAMDVVQNEHTNGAKPASENYYEEKRNGKTVMHGPTGGWCTCFRRKDYLKISLLFRLTRLSFNKCEDGQLQKLFRVYLKLKAGIIKGICCFHACGPYYAKIFGSIDREIDKYKSSGMSKIARTYEDFKD